MIYLVFAILVGSLMLNFVMTLQPDKSTEDIRNIIGQKETIEVQYTKDEFVRSFMDFWKDCAYGEEENTYTVFVRGDGNLTKSEIWDYVDATTEGYEIKKNDIVFQHEPLPLLTRVICHDSKIFLGENLSKTIIYQDSNYLDCDIDDYGFLQCKKPLWNIGKTYILIGTYNGTELIDTERVNITVANYLEVFGDSTYITPNAPGTNFGSAQEIKVSGGADQARALLYFNIPAIDDDKYLGAELKIYLKGGYSNGQHIVIKALQTASTESSATWSIPWTTAGGDMYDPIFAEANIFNNPDGEYVLELSDLVQSWMLNPTVNKGMIVVAQPETNDDLKEFYSDDGPNDFKPRIGIWYLD